MKNTEFLMVVNRYFSERFTPIFSKNATFIDSFIFRQNRSRKVFENILYRKYDVLDLKNIYFWMVEKWVFSKGFNLSYWSKITNF